MTRRHQQHNTHPPTVDAGDTLSFIVWAANARGAEQPTRPERRQGGAEA
jgi:hypothetical protein